MSGRRSRARYGARGTRSTRSRDGIEATRAGVEDGHDVLLLDVGLPGLDGLEVCRRVRAARPAVGILILTGRGDELDAVAGLDAGADDYVAKPFRLAELLARVRARVRERARARPATSASTAMPTARGMATPSSSLSPKEFDLLEFLVRNPGHTITRERIMSESGMGTGSARRRRSTCTCSRCGASSATMPRRRGT